MGDRTITPTGATGDHDRPGVAMTDAAAIERRPARIWEVELRVFSLDQGGRTALLRVFMAPDDTATTEILFEQRGVAIDQLNLAGGSPVGLEEWADLVAAELERAGFDPLRPMDYYAELELGCPEGVAWEVGQRRSAAPPQAKPRSHLWAEGGRQWIYFVEAGPGGPIKIGVAHNPSKRLASLQTGTDAALALLAAVPGDVGLERRLHAEFAPFRRRGEWFEPTPDLLERIRILKATEE